MNTRKRIHLSLYLALIVIFLGVLIAGCPSHPVGESQCITEEEMWTFLDQDDTDLCRFSNCLDYSGVLICNAHDEGIPVALVLISFEETTAKYACVAFPICGDSELVSLDNCICIDAHSDTAIFIALGESFPLCMGSDDYCELYTISKIRIFK